MKAACRMMCLVLALLFVCVPLVGTQAADRGLGGTGAPAAAPAISDRGIGGTGIVGVVTGFGSVFVNGLEVAYTPTTPLTVDGVSDADAALRVGQLATIVASDDHGLRAVSIDVRHEVSGEVTSVSTGAGPSGGMLVVSGQRVAIDSGTEGGQTVHPGDWVAVSGLREPDDVIAATRIDQRSPGTVLVRGVAMSAVGGWRIGDLLIQQPNGAGIAPGTSITARGIMVNGTLSVTAADPDVLSSNPAAFFGSHVQRMVIESYVTAAGGHVRLGREMVAARGPGVVVPAGAHRAIVQFERSAHGEFVAIHLRRATHPGTPHRTPFAPERHSSLGPPHAAPLRFGPDRYRQHPGQDRHPGFGDRGRNRRPR